MTKLLSLLMMLTMSVSMWAGGAGFFGENASTLVLYYQGTSDTEFTMNASDASTMQLGTIHQLYLKQWWFKMWRQEDLIQDAGALHYMVYPKGNRPDPEAWIDSDKSYTDWGDSYSEGNSGNVQHGRNGMDVNLLDGLSAGEYVLEYFFTASLNGSTAYLSNNSQNYKIEFRYGATPVTSNHLFGTYQAKNQPLHNRSTGAYISGVDGLADFYIATMGDVIIGKVVKQGRAMWNNGNTTAFKIWNEEKTSSTSAYLNAYEGSGDVPAKWTADADMSNNKLNNKGTTFPMTLFVQSWASTNAECETDFFTYTRGYVNNPMDDNVAPVCDPATITIDDSGENIVVTFGEVTADEEYFYYVADEDHNIGAISLNNTITIAKPTTHNGVTYNFVCAVVDYNGNMSVAKNYALVMPFDADVNLAQGQPTLSGKPNGENGKDAVVDGKLNTRWSSNGGANYDPANPAACEHWWQVDLGAAYLIDHIHVWYETACPKVYDILGSLDGANWSIIQSYTTAPKTGNGDGNVNVYDFSATHPAARYIKIFSKENNTGWGLSMYEFEVYASGIALPDHVAPVITTFEKVSADVETITFHVEASDLDDEGNHPAILYHVSADNGYGEHSVIPDSEGNFTLEGLIPGVNYTFTLTVTDPSGNTATDKVVTTTGLLAPANVVVAVTGRVSFDEAAYATGYKARIYDGALLLSEQVITNNGVLQFVTTKNAYTVKVISTIDAYSSLESDAAAWAPEAGRVFGVSEYDHFTHKNLNNGGTQVALTWTTDVNGDVVITISPVAPAKDATLRGYLARTDFGADWKVNGVEASTYFTRVVAADKRSTKLVLKDGAQLPYPCVITLTGQHTEWRGTKEDDSESDGYTAAGILDYSYTYGTTCQVIAGVPGNVSISETGRVQHDNVDGAVAYAARFKKDGAIFMQQDITSGEPINWVSTENVEFQVTVLAFDAEGNMFDESETYDWDVEAGKVFGKSKYCEQIFGPAGKEANITWETNSNTGVLSIKITSAQDGVEDSEVFFKETAMSQEYFTYEDAAMTEYFTKGWENNKLQNTITWIPRTDEGHIPQVGGKISFTNGKTVYQYKAGSYDWPNLTFKDYIYGTKCTSADAVAPVISAFTGVSDAATTITFHVEATDVDDEGTPQTITYSLAGDNGFVTIVVTPDGEGNFVVEGLKKNCDYTFTLTVTDPSSNQTISDPITVRMQFDAEDNLALNKPAEAGGEQMETTKAGKAVDGNTSNTNFWTPWGLGADKAWWTVDLGMIYELSSIKIYWHQPSHNYTIYGSFDAEGDTWFDILTDKEASGSDITRELSVNAAARRLKLVATSADITLTEFEVFGSAYATTDGTAPEVTVTEVSKTENTATLKIVATDVDDAGVAHPVKNIAISGDNDFETIENAELDGEGNITLENLKDNATYNFHVTVTDRVGLTASENITVRVAFNTETNLALASNGATAVAGGAENGNEAGKAIDGSATSYWGTYGVGNWETTNVLTITLAASYNINRIAIKTGSFDGANHDATLEYSANGSDWTEFKAFVPFEANHEYDLPVVVTAQYLRFKATKNGMINIQEFEVYGSGYNDPDTEKPVITGVPAIVGEVGEDEATVAVTATDNVGVYACRFTSGKFSEVIDLVAGQCHVTGLVPGTTYTFSVVALDRAGNESDPVVMESFRTVGNDAVPHTAAPAPKQNAIDVTSIYSNAYTSAVKDGFSWKSWSEPTKVSHKTVGDNDYVHFVFAGHGEIGIGSNGGAGSFRGQAGYTTGENLGLNVSNRDYMHMDVWSYTGGTMNITLGNYDLETGIRLAEGEWTSIDIPLAVFAEGEHGELLKNLEYIKLTGVQNLTLAVDNIYFWDELGAVINEGLTDNADMRQFDNRYANVTLHRNFATPGELYTLCLPFSMSEEQIVEHFGDEAEVWMMTGSEDRGSLIHIDFALQSEIVAGKPYLLRPSKEFVAGTTIEGVIVSDTQGETLGLGGDIQMHGYVNKSDFTAADHAYFLFSDAYLHELQAEAHYNGLRAYFTFATAPAAGARARIRLGETVTTDIETLHGAANIELQKVLMNGNIYIIRDGRMYNVQGQLVK